MRKIFFICLISIFSFYSLNYLSFKSIVSANTAYKLINAQIRTEISERCINNSIGFRQYNISAEFDSETRILMGELLVSGEGLITSGTNRNVNYITEFRVLNSRNEIIGTIPPSTLNNIPNNYSFSIPLLASDPYKIIAFRYQLLTQTFCNGVNEDSHEFFYEEDVTNGTFQIPCPVVNKFELTPNPAPPNGQVTLDWDVSNLFQSRFIRFSGPNLPPTDRNTQTGTLTFQAPSTPGDYDYTLEVFDVNGTKLDCLPPAKRTVTVSGGRYFWLVKRMNPLAPATPYLSPFEYYSETLAVPTPPGANPTASFVRIPASGDFEAATPETAAELEPFKTQVSDALRRMEIEDHERTPPLGLITAEKNQAIADYRKALESYRQALAAFQNAQPKSGKGLVGPGNLSHARKTSEEVSPYDN